MKAGIAFDLLRALPGYCPTDLIGVTEAVTRGAPQHPTSTFPCIVCGLQHDSRPHLLETDTFVTRTHVLLQELGYQKLYGRKLFALPLFRTLKIS